MVEMSLDNSDLSSERTSVRASTAAVYVKEGVLLAGFVLWFDESLSWMWNHTFM